MGGPARAKSGRDLKRKGAIRAPYDRVLIVCEGSKTEVNYFREIAREARIPAINVQIIHSPNGTQPKQIVEGAEEVFFRSRSFEKIYAVFDRDQHTTYADAIAMAEARDGRYKNDERKPVSFQAIVSVPCFELWFLLHFVDVMAFMRREDALKLLKQHLVGYEKGNNGTFAATVAYLSVATKRATVLKARCSRLPGTDAYTDVHELVEVLMTLKNN